MSIVITGDSAPCADCKGWGAIKGFTDAGVYTCPRCLGIGFIVFKCEEDDGLAGADDDKGGSVG